MKQPAPHADEKAICLSSMPVTAERSGAGLLILTASRRQARTKRPHTRRKERAEDNAKGEQI